MSNDWLKGGGKWLGALTIVICLWSPARAQFTGFAKAIDWAPYDGTAHSTGPYSTTYRGNYSNGLEGSGSHPGVDITRDKAGTHVSTSTPIHSIYDGIIVRKLVNGKHLQGEGWGNCLVIKHSGIPDAGPTGVIFSAYAHMSSFATNPSTHQEWKLGDTVTKDAVIGFVGETGDAWGVHLHFQIDNDYSDYPRHPFWPNRPGVSPLNEVGIPDNDNLVLNHTINPVAFVDAHLAGTVWPMSGHDPQRTGLSTFRGPALVPLGPSWTFDAAAPIVGDLAVSSGGNIYFAAGARLYALKPDGSLLTAPANLAAPAATSPAIDDRNGRVYIAVGNFLGGGFDIVQYDEQLQNPTTLVHASAGIGGGPSALIVADDGTLYFACGRFPGTLYALGPTHWTQPLCPGEQNGLALGENGSIYAMCPGNSLFKVDAKTGTPTKSVGVDRNFTDPMIDHQNHIWAGNMAFDGIVFAGTYNSWDQDLNLLSADSGFGFQSFTTSRATLLPDGSTVRWSYSFGGQVVLSARGTHGWDVELPNFQVERFSSLPTADADGKIFIGSTLALYCLSPIDGSVIWSFPVDAAVTTQPAISSSGQVYIGTSGGTVYAF